MIDTHCHVLPGIDDGPADLAGSLAMCRAAHAAGTRTIVATPHVSWDHSNDSLIIRRAVREVNEALLEHGIDIEVLPGAEIAMTRAGELDDAELTALHLGGGPYALIECPFSPAAAGFEGMLHQLLARGHKIVLAHPERSPALQRDLDLVRSLVTAGMLCSATAGSYTGHFGRTVRAAAQEMLDAGLIHMITSDAHDTVRRPPVIHAELDSVGFNEEQIDHFARAVPLAVLYGSRIPMAPPIPPRKRKLFGILG